MNLCERSLNTATEGKFPRFPQSTRGKSERERLETPRLYETFHVSTALIITTSFIVSRFLKASVVMMLFVDKFRAAIS